MGISPEDGLENDVSEKYISYGEAVEGEA